MAITNNNAMILIIATFSFEQFKKTINRFYVKHNYYSPYEFLLGKYLADFVLIFLSKHLLVLFNINITSYYVNLINMFITFSLICLFRFLLDLLVISKFFGTLFINLRWFVIFPLVELKAYLFHMSNNKYNKIVKYILLFYPNTYMLFIFTNIIKYINKYHIFGDSKLTMDIFFPKRLKGAYSTSYICDLSEITIKPNQTEIFIYAILAILILLYIIDKIFKMVF